MKNIEILDTAAEIEARINVLKTLFEQPSVVNHFAGGTGTDSLINGIVLHLIDIHSAVNKICDLAEAKD